MWILQQRLHQRIRISKSPDYDLPFKEIIGLDHHKWLPVLLSWCEWFVAESIHNNILKNGESSQYAHSHLLRCLMSTSVMIDKYSTSGLCLVSIIHIFMLNWIHNCLDADASHNVGTTVSLSGKVGTHRGVAEIFSRTESQNVLCLILLCNKFCIFIS